MEKFPWLTDEARLFLERGYLQNGETPEERYREISDKLEEISGIKGFGDRFFDYCRKNWVSLASPVFANFGKPYNLPASCNKGILEDSMDGIFSALREVALLAKNGAGTAKDFSNIRPLGASISTGGTSDGPLSWIELFEKAILKTSQSSVRRGFFTAYLSVDHPDIMDFLRCCREGSPIQHITTGVTIPPGWIKEMKDGDERKRKIYSEILRSRYEIGFPYILFLDNCNEGKPQHYKDLGLDIKTSNICVAGSELVPTDRGLKTAEELWKEGGELTVFDGEKQVKASAMQKISESAETYTIYLDNGMTHTITPEHKVCTKEGDIECQHLKVGDLVKIQTKASGFAEGLINNITKILYDGWDIKTDNLQRTQLEFSNCGRKTKIVKKDGELVLEKDSSEGEYSAVVGVERAPNQPVYCLTVDSENHHWVCNGVITHNCNEIVDYCDPQTEFVCVLSSVNLVHYDQWKDTDLVYDLRIALDCIVTEYIEKARTKPGFEKVVKFAENYRSVGLGVLGFHDLLQSKMIPFGSLDSFKVNNEIFKLLRDETDRASRWMAQEWGEPPGLKGFGVRSGTNVAIAPTKSTSFIMGNRSPSIEVIKSNYTEKELAKIQSEYKNPQLEQLLIEKELNVDWVWDKINEDGGSVQNLPDHVLSEAEKEVFKTAYEISQMDIIKLAGQRQKYIDQGQSLNLFVHPKTPPKDISNLVLTAHSEGVKGLYYQYNISAAKEFSRELVTCSSCEG